MMLLISTASANSFTITSNMIIDHRSDGPCNIYLIDFSPSALNHIEVMSFKMLNIKRNGSESCPFANSHLDPPMHWAESSSLDRIVRGLFA